MARIRCLLTIYTADAPRISPPPLVYMQPKQSLYMHSKPPSILEPSFLKISPIISVAWLLESLPHRRNHPPEPVEIKHTQRRIADHIGSRQPRRYRQTSRRLKRSPNVLIHPHALPRAPDQATGSERRDERDAVDELGGGSGHVELVQEPVDVEKGRRELVEDEIQAVVVAEGPLGVVSLDASSSLFRRRSAALTNPNNDTASALAACISAPGPCTSMSTALVARSQRKYPAANP